MHKVRVFSCIVGCACISCISCSLPWTITPSPCIDLTDLMRALARPALCCMQDHHVFRRSIPQPHCVHTFMTSHAKLLMQAPCSCISCAIRIFTLIRVQRLTRIVTHRFDNPQAFCPTFPKQYPLTHSQILGPLYEPKCNRRSIARPNERTIDIDDRASLADRTNVQHGLIFRLDGGGV